MDFSAVSLSPGKYKAHLDYEDVLLGAVKTRTFEFSTPKAPPLISQAAYAPIVSKPFTESLVTPPITVPSPTKKQRTLQTVTLTFATDHGIPAGSKITVSGSTDIGGTFIILPITNKRQISYKTIASGTIPLTSITGITVSFYNVLKTIIANYYQNVSIPGTVADSLMWTKTIRDVVFFLYKNGDTPLLASTAAIKYATDGSDFTTSVPTYPSGVTNKIKSAKIPVKNYGAYEFRYVIVRYELVNGSWVGYFPMLNADDSIIISEKGIVK